MAKKKKLCTQSCALVGSFDPWATPRTEIQSVQATRAADVDELAQQALRSAMPPPCTGREFPAQPILVAQSSVWDSGEQSSRRPPAVPMATLSATEVRVAKDITNRLKGSCVCGRGVGCGIVAVYVATRARRQGRPHFVGLAARPLP